MRGSVTGTTTLHVSSGGRPALGAIRPWSYEGASEPRTKMRDLPREETRNA